MDGEFVGVARGQELLHEHHVTGAVVRRLDRIVFVEVELPEGHPGQGLRRVLCLWAGGVTQFDSGQHVALVFGDDA